MDLSSLLFHLCTSSMDALLVNMDRRVLPHLFTQEPSIYLLSTYTTTLPTQQPSDIHPIPYRQIHPLPPDHPVEQSSGLGLRNAEKRTHRESLALPKNGLAV